MNPEADITGLLAAWCDGEHTARSDLLEIVYGELQQLAKAYLRREPSHHSVTATALVHEAYVKLVDQRFVRWQNRHHFFGVAAQAMRRLLVDHARANRAAKRGGHQAELELAGGREAWMLPPDVDVLGLDAALSRLESFEPRWSRLVELRFFAGLTVEETATALDLSPATVKRDWSLARAWLYRELQGVRE